MLTLEKRLEKISMLCIGSRGDIQPYVAVAIALQKKGYQVRFWTSAAYIDFVTSFGLVGVPVCTDVEKVMRETPSLRKAMANGNTIFTFKALGRYFKSDAPIVCKAVLEDLRDYEPDLILPNSLGSYFAWYASLKMGIPFLTLGAQAIVYNPDHMIFGLPTLPMGMHYHILYDILVPGLFDMFRPYDRYLKTNVLKLISLKRFKQELQEPTMPQIILSSPFIAQNIYPNADEKLKFVGVTVIESDQQVNHPKFGGNIQRFQDFLDQGPAVYVGWGSMISKSSTHMAVMAVRAIRHAQVRAIVLGGFADIGLEALQAAKVADQKELVEYAIQNILFAATAPHEWLFPRVTCTVHHGGAGTTTTALRAGVPTVITPVFLDQFDFSYMVRQVGNGIGFKKQLQKITWRELGDAIRIASTDADMKTKAEAVGCILRAENGAESAARTVETLWTDFCTSGQLEAVLPKMPNTPEPPKKTERRKRSERLSKLFFRRSADSGLSQSTASLSSNEASSDDGSEDIEPCTA